MEDVINVIFKNPKKTNLFIQASNGLGVSNQTATRMQVLYFITKGHVIDS